MMIALAWRLQAPMMLKMLANLISKTLKATALSPDNRDIERSEDGSTQSPPEAFTRACWAFHFAYRSGRAHVPVMTGST
jgi:hypothetical protein